MAGGRRYASLVDFENFVKLTYDTPWLHHSGGTVCEPVDVPVNKRHLDMVYAHLRYSDKALMGSVTEPTRAQESIEMMRIMFGDDFVDNNCVILGNVNVNSPLVWDSTMTGSLRPTPPRIRRRWWCRSSSVVRWDPSRPLVPIAQAHAEMFVGVALAQLTRPGSPVIYGNFLSSMDCVRGSPTFGTPEPAFGSLSSANWRVASACRCVVRERSPRRRSPTARR